MHKAGTLKQTQRQDAKYGTQNGTAQERGDQRGDGRLLLHKDRRNQQRADQRGDTAGADNLAQRAQVEVARVALEIPGQERADHNCRERPAPSRRPAHSE